MQHRLLPAFAVSVVLAFIGGCSGSSTVTPPPTAVNTPPTLDSLVMASDRAEADRPVQVTAVVRDAETPVGTLTYTWSASPQTGTFGGTTSFTGAQASNTWRVPKNQTSPDLYTIMLTVTERDVAGQPRQNTVSKTVTVHYNDSPAEVAALGDDFLVTKFGNFNVTPAEAVSNFSDSCPGKAEELADIENNRANFHILSGSVQLAGNGGFNDTLTAGRGRRACSSRTFPNSGPKRRQGAEFVSGDLPADHSVREFPLVPLQEQLQPPFNTARKPAGSCAGQPYPE